MAQTVTQAVVTEQAELRPHQTVEKFALFNADGTPVVFGAAGVASAEISDFPTVAAAPIADGDTVAEALAKLQAQIDALP